MTSLVDVNTYQFLQNICPFSAARHRLSATRPTAWWMELMDMAACPALARLNWHIREERARQRDKETEGRTWSAAQRYPASKHLKDRNMEESSTQMSKTTEENIIYNIGLKSEYAYYKKLCCKGATSFVSSLLFISSWHYFSAPFQNFKATSDVKSCELVWDERVNVLLSLIKLTSWRNMVSILAYFPCV